VSDLPPDVRSTLTQLLSEAAAAARARDEETLVSLMESVAAVTAEDVPEGELKGQLRHGRRRVDRLASDEPLVAAAYCEAMRRRVAA
jgi:hypothetical protein